MTDTYSVSLIDRNQEVKVGVQHLAISANGSLQNVCFLFLPLWALADPEPLGHKGGRLPPGGTIIISLNY